MRKRSNSTEKQRAGGQFVARPDTFLTPAGVVIRVEKWMKKLGIFIRPPL